MLGTLVRFIIIYIAVLPFGSQAQDTLKLNRQECEAIFLKENLLLIAEKLQISQAEAMVIQAKLWPNPSVSLDEVNLWATQQQLGVFGEELPAFGNGSLGKNQQISFSVEQLILTAGKRGKLVALEQVNVEKYQQYFQDLLRNLKAEFRQQMTKLQFLQSNVRIYQNQLSSVRQLTMAYLRQVDQGNVPRGEYIRLKALELEIARQINQVNLDINDCQKELKMLMRLPYSTHLVITDDEFLRDINPYRALTLDNLIEQAKLSRPDFKISDLDQSYYSKLYNYQKAFRTPDLTLKGGYDRGGNFMFNFVGFGLAVDLPVFNRNQGYIQHARIGMDYAKTMYQQMELTVENEIAKAFRDLSMAIRFLSDIEPGYENTLDDLLNSYTRNFINRNVSMLEYLDFLDAYLENKRIILEADRDVNDKIEELVYAVGSELFN